MNFWDFCQPEAGFQCSQKPLDFCAFCGPTADLTSRVKLCHSDITRESPVSSLGVSWGVRRSTTLSFHSKIPSKLPQAGSLFESCGTARGVQAGIETHGEADGGGGRNAFFPGFNITRRRITGVDLLSVSPVFPCLRGLRIRSLFPLFRALVPSSCSEHLSRTVPQNISPKTLPPQHYPHISTPLSALCHWSADLAKSIYFSAS